VGACNYQLVPSDCDGVFFSLVQFDFKAEMSAKGESPLTYTIGIIRQIFESSTGFDGAKWPLFPSFELPRLAIGSAIQPGTIGIKNGRGKLMAMFLTVLRPVEQPVWCVALLTFVASVASNWHRTCPLLAWLSEAKCDNEAQRTACLCRKTIQRHAFMTHDELAVELELLKPAVLTVARLQSNVRWATSAQDVWCNGCH
jgi:hypothetical protein